VLLAPRLISAAFATLISLGVGGGSASALSSPVRFTSHPKAVTPGATWVAVAAVPKANTCALRITRGKIIGLATSPARVNGRTFTAGFTVSSKPAAGRWTSRLRCATSRKRFLRGLGRTARRTFTVKAGAGGRGGLVQKTSDVVDAAPSPDGLGAAAGSRWGQVLVDAGDWAGGVEVRSNNLNGCPRVAYDGGYAYCNVRGTTEFGGNGRTFDTGLQYQCVELINRMLVARGWAEPIRGNAYQLFAKAPAASFDKHPRGDGYRPVPGDIAVYGTAYYPNFGHVAVVDRVIGNTVVVRQQNSSSTASELHLTGNSIRESYVTGFLHAKANRSNGSSGSSPAGSQPNAGGDSATPLPASRLADELAFVRSNHASGKTEIVAYHGSPAYTTMLHAGLTGYPATVDPANVKALSLDVNGDGIDELGFVRFNHASGNTELAVYHGSPHYTTLLSAGPTGYPAINDPHNVTPIALDVNGDRIDELAFARGNHGSGKTEIVLYHGSPAYTTLLHIGLTGYPATNDPAHVKATKLDTNGDGVDELGFVRLNYFSGNTELVVYHGSPHYTTLLSAGPTSYPSIADPLNVTPIAIQAN
jgi:surface antigen